MDPHREGGERVTDRAGTARRRWVRIVAVASLLAVIVAMVATARLFVWPPTGAPASADAVVMLSGDHGERIPLALALVHAGVARIFVHAGEPDGPAAEQLCSTPQVFEVVCLRPAPDSTRTEAEAVGRLARDRHWKTVVVVTSTQHLARAGLLFRRCVDGRVDMVKAKPSFPWQVTARLIAQEWAKLAYSQILRRGC